MPTLLQRILWLVSILGLFAHAADADSPRVTNGKYKLELVASEPEIVTPVGMTFDSKGRLLVIESHTHHRPEGYEGPASDRVRMLSDSDGDGRLDRWSTFAEGFRHAMNLIARPDGSVYLVTRRNMVLLRDADHDSNAEKQDELLRLETEGDYPHNGLSGIAREENGSLLVGLGENLGMPYRLVGADRTVISGTGGQDGIYRITAEGKKLERVARGMWNPFSVCVLPDGRIFAVDNDPDASPPCRLLHVVEGGDYGYLYQYGRAGTHPLQAWDGELPGTLPMVCGVGEGPTAVVAHAGSLWVTSWGDHRIERYMLALRGSSYGAKREVAVQGDADFRPTGMAVAPDGSLYFGDWVLRDYPVHGRGRIWRLTLPQEESDTPFPLPTFEQAEFDDSFNQTRKTWHLSRGLKPSWIVQQWESGKEGLGTRFDYLAALRMGGFDAPNALLQAALEDKSPAVRLYAVRWIADERIIELRDAVAKLLEGPQPSTQYYLAVLAALDWLDHEPSMRGTQIADELLLKELGNEARSPESHVLALRLLSPNSKFLSLDRLRSYLQSEHEPLRLEAVRTLAQQSNPKRFELLAAIAGDEGEKDELRAEAIVGLAADAEPNRELLEHLADGRAPVSKGEAQRVLRLAKLRPAAEEAKPQAEDLARWNELLGEAGDAAAGRRLFFSPIGPRCGVCHQHTGRGGRVGPDLTHIGRSNNHQQIVASLLQPSREVAPHYQPWVLVTKDGRTHTGLRQPKAGDSDTEFYVDSAGNEFSLPSDTIEQRSASEKSIMPDGLQAGMTIADLRDLIAFLTAANDAPGH